MPQVNIDKEINIEYCATIIFQLASESYILTLYKYERKFMLYDNLFWQKLLIEQQNRLKTSNYKDKSRENINKLTNELLENYICPDRIKEYLYNCYKKNKKLIKKINAIVNEFNSKYENNMENYIEFINNIADSTTISIKNIVPKGIGILGEWKSSDSMKKLRNILFGMDMNEIKKAKNRIEQEKKLKKDMELKINKAREELCQCIINNYQSFANDILNILSNN